MPSDNLGNANVDLAKKLINFASNQTNNREQIPEIIKPIVLPVVPRCVKQSEAMSDISQYGNITSSDFHDKQTCLKDDTQVPKEHTVNYERTDIPPLSHVTMTTPKTDFTRSIDKTVNFVRNDKPEIEVPVSNKRKLPDQKRSYNKKNRLFENFASKF